ncbi:hypothetical protein HK096_002684, partial [Nowakowskiella sp. JEL0078]
NLPLKYVDYFKELALLCDPQAGFSNYWADFRMAQPPAVPFIGSYMHDLLEVHEEVPIYLGEARSISPNSDATEETDELNSKIVNFRKYHDLFSIITELEVFRLSSYREPAVRPGSPSSSTSNWGSQGSLVGSSPSGNAAAVAPSDAAASLFNHMKDNVNQAAAEDADVTRNPLSPQSTESESEGISVKSMKRLSGFLMGSKNSK